MSYGIPSLYIASKDSQLQIYADKYQHAACYNKQELNGAKNYILNLIEDQKQYTQVCKNARQAAKDFKRENADKFVEQYIKAK